MKLLIAIPTLDYMNVEFTRSLTALVMRLKDEGIDFDVEFKSGTLVYVARDLLATKAIQEGYTHVLWLDSDMVFNDDLVEDLSFCKRDFVSAICHGRRPPHFSCLFSSLEPVERFTAKDYPTSPFMIAGSGFGCVFMTTKCLKAVKDKYGTCFLPMANLGEDLAFCLRLSTCDISMWADPGVRLGHIGHIAIYPEQEELWASTVEGLR